MRVFIYARVSTSAQDNERQIDDIRTFCNEKNYEIVHIYQETVSGAKKVSERIQIDSLLKRVEKGKEVVNGVITWELSRLGRNTQHILEIIDRLKKCRVWVYFKKENVYTLDIDGNKENPLGSLMITILSGFATMERETITERSISGLKMAVKEGKWTGGARIPYGYKRIEKKLEIDEKESETIKYIFKKYLEGKGTKLIANDLNHKNIKTRTQILYKDAGMTWKDGTIYSILTNKTYIGKKKGKGHIEEMHLVSPQIIDEETFNRVQKMLKSKYRRADKIGIYILKDKLKCGDCGKNYYPHNRKNGNDKYYKCLSKRYGSKCSNYGIGIEKIQNAVWTAIRNNEDLLKKIYQDAGTNERIEQKLKSIKTDLEEKDNQLSEINSKKLKIVNLLMEGKIDDNTYTKVFSEYKTLETQLRNDIENANSEYKETKLILSNNSSINKILKKIKEDKSTFRGMVNKIIEKIIIHPIEKEKHNLELILPKINRQNSYLFVEIHTLGNEGSPLCFVIGQRNKEIVFCTEEEYNKDDKSFEFMGKYSHGPVMKNIINLRFSI